MSDDPDAREAIMSDLKDFPKNDRSFNSQGDIRTEQVTGTTSGQVELEETVFNISEPFEPKSVELRDEKQVKE